ncbi:COQ9 family protein [Roseococcus sp. SYP-B2431]|uniref:COQ9 family protein n=1 Tax=Roseococcus sp. SYP-B2431 TaxID=2496640 RepID=UPI00103A1E8B|nr:COQ9 family protein [Roseococcus sp. SYP-B2431]TCI00950.1 COQ9 family protein [Roseococcus sp. SYP-B2431]
MSEADLLRAVVARAGREGWTTATLRHALEDRGEGAELASSHFPRGVAGAIDSWFALVDAEMEAAAAAEDLAALRTPARIRRLIELRLIALEPDREALRGAVALLALPWNLPTALRCAARSASAIWYAAGDESADFSWYTRRATLMAVQGAVLAFWLRPNPPTLEETLSFLDRRLSELPKPHPKAA